MTARKRFLMTTCKHIYISAFFSRQVLKTSFIRFDDKKVLSKSPINSSQKKKLSNLVVTYRGR